ncbi:hypothetical protein DLAC_09502 [Tieghemostelium lacteum]|uniref:Uncharacterized protein n=1 Tax=Tieghemostelium lacteum TaxID=361077 RepID=A0A151Z6G4_TIELA|nr:hypothetical protein DLAC_09502 [Tieghemostelium lacteum]|eukprot:KYQ89553.1 hypothetical protein DLAC_09502 [Tieghemostelium lacteum]
MNKRKLDEIDDDEIHKKNLNYLYCISNFMQPLDANLGRFYMYKFRESANIHHLKGMPIDIESRNCMNCGSFLVPGVNCRVRITPKEELSNKSKSKISNDKYQEINSLIDKSEQRKGKSVIHKPHNAIVHTCLECQLLNPIKGEKMISRKKRRSQEQNYFKEKEDSINTVLDNVNNNNNNNNNNEKPQKIEQTKTSKSQNTPISKNKNKENSNTKKPISILSKSPSSHKQNHNNSQNNNAGKKDDLGDFMKGIGSLFK